MGLRSAVRRALSALTLIAILTAGGLAITAGVAAAAGSYPPSPPPTQVAPPASVTPPPPAQPVALPPTSVPPSGLAFTGAEIGAIATVGGLLIAGGAGILAARRRMNHRES